MFLQYLDLEDIGNLDTAFCNHAERPVWLSLLKGYIVPSVEIVNNKNLKKMTDWLISKHIHLDKLSFKYVSRLANDGASFNHENISLLSQNNPNLNELTINNESVNRNAHEILFPFVV